jgi:acetylornithine deacetylase
MLTQNAIYLLQDLIRLESFSGSENQTASRLEKWFSSYNIPFQRKDHNIWATNKYFDTHKPTLLLNTTLRDAAQTSQLFYSFKRRC